VASLPLISFFIFLLLQWLCDYFYSQIWALSFAEAASGAAAFYFNYTIRCNLERLLWTSLNANETAFAPCRIPADAGVVDVLGRRCNHLSFPLLIYNPFVNDRFYNEVTFYHKVFIKSNISKSFNEDKVGQTIVFSMM
jgi:hypothetical protein